MHIFLTLFGYFRPNGSNKKSVTFRRRYEMQIIPSSSQLYRELNSGNTLEYFER